MYLSCDTMSGVIAKFQHIVTQSEPVKLLKVREPKAICDAHVCLARVYD